MPPKKVAKGYKHAEPLPLGTILEDISKKQWRLGSSIGKGGFGEIYCAQEAGTKNKQFPYVIKIEPHSNGPLFVEINFYIRYAKKDDIEQYKKQKQQEMLGMPVFLGSGSHEYNGNKYRFLVIEKFSSDLLELFSVNKMFPTDTVFKLGVQILDVLEYIHSRGCVHADIKAANLLLGSSKETENKQVFLVDFGLATKYSSEKEFKPNPKKAHDGTLEYTSRDAHYGVQTRRGDLEILAYNLIHWLGGKLPWENISDPKMVQSKKEECMATVSKMISSSFSEKSYPSALVEFLKYLKTLEFNTEPDYEKIREIFISGVKESNGSIGTPLQFTVQKSPAKRTRTQLPEDRRKKRKTNDEIKENNEEQTTNIRKSGRSKRNQKTVVEEKEKTHKKIKVPVDAKRTLTNGTKRGSSGNFNNDMDFQGFTEAMKEVALKKIKKEGRRTKTDKKTKS